MLVLIDDAALLLVIVLATLYGGGGTSVDIVLKDPVKRVFAGSTPGHLISDPGSWASQVE